MGMMSTAVRGQVEVSRTSQLEPWKLYEKLKSIAKLLFSKPPFFRSLGGGLQRNMVGTFFLICVMNQVEVNHMCLVGLEA